MPRPFEITYSPASWNAPADGVATSWTQPYGGLNVQAPPNLIAPSETPVMNNFMFRNRELRSRPAFRALFPSPDGNPIIGVRSFLSKNGVWHTLAWTAQAAYQLQANAALVINQGANPWSLVGGPQQPSAFVRSRVFQNILYWTGSSDVSAWDGAALKPINDVAWVGATTTSANPPFALPSQTANTTIIGALYVGELDNHIILLNTTETTFPNGTNSAPNSPVAFPQRMRWSNSGFNPILNGNFGQNLGTVGATFDPTVNVNAGLVDMLDVPDVITGGVFIGRVGYIFRQNGLTEASPTGIGTNPFDLNHMWASENGIGNVYTASIAQYGDHAAFIATDNIYGLTPGQLNAIGLGARDAVMADLASTMVTPTAVISPAFTLGYNYLVYMIFILLPNGNTRVYVLSLEDNNWAVWTLSGVSVGIADKCWIGDTPLAITTTLNVGNKSGGGGGGGQGGQGGGGGGSGQKQHPLF